MTVERRWVRISFSRSKPSSAIRSFAPELAKVSGWRKALLTKKVSLPMLQNRQEQRNTMTCVGRYYAVHKRGLPESVRMKHDLHYVDELFQDQTGAIGRYIPTDLIRPNPNQPRQNIGD